VAPGNKKDNVTIIYTPWSNLKKDASMATGQVSFHDQKMVKKVHVATRQNPIVNRLNKTKVEKFPDLRTERDVDQREKRKTERIQREQEKAKDREEKKRRDELRYHKDHAYDDLMREENMVSNQDRDADFYDDDFM
jgi:long-subunit acyl-CoA synthetase (AMP-forming)